MANATITLSVPEKLKEEMNSFKEVNWSAETRAFFEERLKRLKLLKQLDEITKSSTLTDEDVIEIGNKIKKGVAEWHEKQLKKRGS